MIKTDLEKENTMELLKELTNQDLLDVGMDQIAYIRHTKDSNASQDIFTIHAADGSQISVMDSYDMALAAIRVNDLFPVTVH